MRCLHALALIAVASCFSGDGTLGAVCTRDGDCGKGQGCKHEICGRCGDGTPQGGEVCYARDVAVAADPARVAAVAADLDDNGVLDVVSVAGAGDVLEVRLGGGDGSFGDPAAVALGFAVADMHVGDVDADGSVDVVVAGPMGFEVLFGDGTGGLVGGGQVSGVATTSVAVDGTGEAPPRVLVSGPFGITVFAQDPPRTLTPVGDIAFGNDPTLSQVAFFDDDQLGDVAGVDAASLIIGFGAEGLTYGVTQTLPVEGGPVSVEVAELTGDGRNDVVTVNADATLTLFAANSAGEFEARDTIATTTGPTRARGTDVNRDGARDLLVATAGGLSVHLRRGGEFPYRTTIDDAAVLDVFVGAVDSDAFEDLLTLETTGATTTLLADP